MKNHKKVCAEKFFANKMWYTTCIETQQTIFFTKERKTFKNAEPEINEST